MAGHDMCADVAALLNPFPSADDIDADEDISEIPTTQLEEEREEMAESLRNAWSGGGIDPLLDTLSGLRQQRLRLEEEMRLLIAYARHFTHPRPYKLIDLANAAGMSISGVRTAYEVEEIGRVAEILGRRPLDHQAVSSGD
jgi:hypothetical protein